MGLGGDDRSEIGCRGRARVRVSLSPRPGTPAPRGACCACSLTQRPEFAFADRQQDIRATKPRPTTRAHASPPFAAQDALRRRPGILRQSLPLWARRAVPFHRRRLGRSGPNCGAGHGLHRAGHACQPTYGNKLSSRRNVYAAPVDADHDPVREIVPPGVAVGVPYRERSSAPCLGSIPALAVNSRDSQFSGCRINVLWAVSFPADGSKAKRFKPPSNQRGS